MFPAQSCSVSPGLGCALSSASCREVAAEGGAGPATDSWGQLGVSAACCPLWLLGAMLLTAGRRKHGAVSSLWPLKTIFVFCHIRELLALSFPSKMLP